jgi:pimeloyl-ACP methyl ester carboxylesterase
MRRSWQWDVRLLASLVVLLAAPLGSGAAPSLLRPCAHGARCGEIERPLDPTGVVPGTVTITFEVYPATGRREGTLVATEGGPGYPATESRADYLALLGPLRRHRDLVLMDNRGTGRSGALACAAIDTAVRLTPEVIGACGEALGPRAPLYGTALAADDLEAVLEALGTGPVDLYGDSYGTFFAQVFALRHPERLRALVLDGAYPLDDPRFLWLEAYAPSMRAKFDLACERDVRCRARPGHPSERIALAVAKLRSDPAPGFTASRYATLLFGSAPSLASLQEADAATRAYLAGDGAPLARLMDEAERATDSRDPAGPGAFSGTLAAAVTCTDSIQVADPTLPPAARRAAFERALLAREASHPDTFAPFIYREYLGLPADYRYLDECLDWPAADPAHVPAARLGATHPYQALPVLVVSGDLDNITSVAEGEAAARAWPRATHVVIGNGLHVNALPRGRSHCAVEIVRRFLLTHAARGVACAAPPALLVDGFVREASQLVPPEPLPRDRGGAGEHALAAAAIATLGDVLRHPDLTLGLRGGRVTRVGTQGAHRLEAVRYTEDVTVSGVVQTREPRATGTARLELRGPGGPQGTLKLRWNGTALIAEGRLRGRLVRVRAPAP